MFGAEDWGFGGGAKMRSEVSNASDASKGPPCKLTLARVQQAECLVYRKREVQMN